MYLLCSIALHIGRIGVDISFIMSFEFFYKNQRFYWRWLDKIIYKTDIKFWADLGSQGCREKNLPTAISEQLFEVVF